MLPSSPFLYANILVYVWQFPYGWLIFIWSLQDVDYEATMATKLSIAKKIFTLEKDLILNSSSFQEFFSENEVLLLHIIAAYICWQQTFFLILFVSPNFLPSLIMNSLFNYLFLFYLNCYTDSAFFLMIMIIGLVETLCRFLFPAGFLWNIRA